MKKLIIMIDGGHLRSLAKQSRKIYNPAFIESFSKSLVGQEEDLIRVLYYDCKPYQGIQNSPISKLPKEFNLSGQWLEDLAARDLFAVRLGVLKWRGWKPKTGHGRKSDDPLTDEDFIPDFEQKGVDLRIGLDIATFALGRIVDRIAIVTGDTDLIPALKLARRQGLQIIGAVLPNHRPILELAAHMDLKRHVDWP